jgi:hypothetical protein
MLEFIFFHQNICSIFTDYLAELNIEYQVDDDGDSLVVAIADDVDDVRLEYIEDEYDRMLDLTREQTDSEEGESPENYQKASLLISLKDGSNSYAHVDMDIINRVLRAINTDELNQIIESVVDAVENPDDRSYCQIIKDSNNDS